jgi:hypothetical protein
MAELKACGTVERMAVQSAVHPAEQKAAPKAAPKVASLAV